MSCNNHNANVQVECLPTVDEIVEICYQKFYMLPKAALPKPNEWTIMAAVVLYNVTSRKCQIISIGSGTKCIGKSKLCSRGLILNDWHAEVLARRGLIRFLYTELNKALNRDADESIFTWSAEEAVFKLKVGYSFHFLSTQAPCGDACILDTSSRVTWDHGHCILPNEMIFTGARLIGGQYDDTMEQLIGAVRTKPGRGERTLSMSCSDKLAKWQIVGVQGALISALIDKPIYFKTLNFCGESDIHSLERALWLRFVINSNRNLNLQLQKPIIRLYHLNRFLYKKDVAKQPTPNGVIWCSVPENEKRLEVSVNGKRQGATTKHLFTPQAALRISKYYLFLNFLHLIKLQSNLLSKFQLEINQLGTLHYNHAKSLAFKYQKAWKTAKLHYFKEWIRKPQELLQFTAPFENEKLTDICKK